MSQLAEFEKLMLEGGQTIEKRQETEGARYTHITMQDTRFSFDEEGELITVNNLRNGRPRQ